MNNIFKFCIICIIGNAAKAELEDLTYFGDSDISILTNITQSELEPNIKNNKEEITLLLNKNNRLYSDIQKCLRNLTDIEQEKREAELNQFKQDNANLTSELRECQLQKNQSQENDELQKLRLDNLNLIKQIQKLNGTLLQPAEDSTCRPNIIPYHDPAISPRMGVDVECKNGGILRRKGNGCECDCPVGFTGDVCEHNEPLGQACYMKDNGYVELHRSSIVEGGSSQNNISFALRFTTTQSKGLLFWFGQNKLESSTEQDFIALFVEDGYLVYVFRLNGSEHRLSTSIIINNGQQYHVIIQQIGNQGMIDIPDFDYFYDVRGEPINKDAMFNLPGNLFLGGAPDLIKFTGRRCVNGFHCCIYIVEDQYGSVIDLGQNAVSTLNVGVCPE